MTKIWALNAGVYGKWKTKDVLDPVSLTAHQRDMVVRHAANLREAANARSEYLAGHLKGLADACSKSIAKKRLELAGIQKELKAVDGSGQNLLKLSAAKKKRERLALIQQGVDRSEGRRQRLLSASFKDKEDWSKAWREARNQSWLFEGSKSATSANPEVKWSPETSVLRIRLTEDQALARMEDYAKEQGLALTDVLHGPASKFGSIRKACDYLEVPLNFDGQDKKLEKFVQALTPVKNEEAKGTQPCKAPISWRIWIEGDLNTSKSCKVYARAQWKEEEVDLISFQSNGCLGLDINAWGVSTAWCNQAGNTPSKDYGPYVHDVRIDWKDKSSNQTLHAVRNAAKEIVDGCARLGAVLAYEALDFSDKKKSLRYEDPKRAKQLSGFAYQKLIETIEARAKKVGVEVRKVDPAYTSVVGWAKYGSRLGLNPDQAAAFEIARRGVLSKGDAIKRRKVKGEWIDLYAKKENLTEFETNELSSVLKSEEGKAKKAKRRGPQQSMRVSKSSPESGLARALGSERRVWAEKLAKIRKSFTKGNILLREDASSAPKKWPAAKDSRARTSLNP